MRIVHGVGRAGGTRLTYITADFDESKTADTDEHICGKRSMEPKKRPDGDDRRVWLQKEGGYGLSAGRLQG
jgi:hypothetical protein